MLTSFENMSLKKITLIFCLLTIGVMCEKATAQTKWKLTKSTNGVDIYTRTKPGWGIKEFKAFVKIKASLTQVEAAIKDAENRSKWMHNTEDTKDIKIVSPNKIYTYSRLDAPWPVSDRDNVTLFTFDRPSPTVVRITMKAAGDYIPEKNGIVRIYRMEGFWELIDLGNGYIKVVQQAVGDPGGSLPDWLANSAIVDNPYNTMLNFKYFVESRNVQLSNYRK